VRGLGLILIAWTSSGRIPVQECPLSCPKLLTHSKCG